MEVPHSSMTNNAERRSRRMPAKIQGLLANPGAAQSSRLRRGAARLLARISDGERILPIGRWPNDFAGIKDCGKGVDSGERGKNRRRTEAAGEMVARAAVASLAGHHRRGAVAAVAMADDGGRIDGRRNRRALNEIDAAGDRVSASAQAAIDPIARRHLVRM